MKASILFSLLVYFLLSLSSSTKKCIIQPKVGLDNIQLNTSTLKNVMDEYDESTIHKKWTKAVETELIGKNERYVVVSEVATFLSRKRRKKISKIIFESPCQCKTKEGIGIGSSYNETISAYGNLRCYYIENEKGEKIITLYYERMQLFFDGNNTDNCKISKIEMY